MGATPQESKEKKPRGKKAAGAPHSIMNLIGKRVTTFDRHGDVVPGHTIILRSIEPTWVGLEVDGITVYFNSDQLGGITEYNEQHNDINKFKDLKGKTK